jgi:hypothetical protein
MLVLKVTGSFVSSWSEGFFVVGIESESIYNEDNGFNEDDKEKYAYVHVRNLGVGWEESGAERT